MLMSNDDIRRIEVITDVARRRYRPAHEKLRIIEESLAPESPSLRWPDGTAWRRTSCSGGAG